MPTLLQQPDEVFRDLTCRRLALRQSSIDEEQRTFEAVVATETPAQVFDWRSGQIVDEVLIASGGEFPESVVLLDDHNRHEGISSVVGSADSFRLDGDRWVGRGRISRPVEGNIDRAQLWQDLIDGHIRAVSIGYQVQQFEDIKPGQSQTIEGRTFSAPSEGRTLRVTSRWQVHELSLTPIGADRDAAIRKQPAVTMPRKRRSLFR